MSDRTLKAALFYHKTGFSVIPCIPPTMDEKGKDIKKPRIEWTEFQTRKADDAEITGWWQKWPDSRVGIVTGKISDLTVLDCDSTDAVQIIEEHLPDNFQVPIAISPRGGRHYYFRHCSEIANKANLAKGLDASSWELTVTLTACEYPRGTWARLWFYRIRRREGRRWKIKQR